MPVSLIATAALANAALRTMKITQLKIAMGLFLVTSLGLLCGGAMARHILVQPTETPAQAQKKDQPRATADADNGERMTVGGRVIDSKGKPLANAEVAVLAGVQRSRRTIAVGSVHAVLGVSKTDDAGRF